MKVKFYSIFGGLGCVNFIILGLFLSAATVSSLQPIRYEIEFLGNCLASIHFMICLYLFQLFTREMKSPTKKSNKPGISKIITSWNRAFSRSRYEEREIEMSGVVGRGGEEVADAVADATPSQLGMMSSGFILDS